MKKLISAASAALAVTVLSVPCVNAAQIKTDSVSVSAAVTDGGSPKACEVSEIKNLTGTQEYELYVNKKTVLSVGASAASEKRYHAEFMIPGTQNEVYLAGLTSENVEEIQQAVIDSYVEGERFDIEDLNFIDAEKNMKGDENLCWAASCANMLVYSGWAERAGFANEDEVFNLYINNYNNDGGFQRDGIAWFFNGIAYGANSGFSGAQITDYPNSGNYFNTYAYDMVCNYGNIRTTDEMNQMIDKLKSGYAVSPGIGIWSDGKRGGGHAITLWGIVTDVSLGENNPNRYRAVFITDSDSDTDSINRASAKNILNMMPLYLNSNGQFAFDYEDGLSATLEDYTYLLPYSKNVPRERDLSTMRNKIKYPDLCFGAVNLNSSMYATGRKTLFESGTKLYLSYYVENAADKTYRSPVSVNRKITDSNGKSVFDETTTVASRGLNLATSTDTNYDIITKLPAGDYTVTMKVNEKRPEFEAYYYNNTFTFDFKMRDKYTLGDCNGDGKIDIRDVTEIQRLLAFYSENVKAAERGDVTEDGLSINDATAVQYYLAKIKIDYPIGEKRLYTVI